MHELAELWSAKSADHLHRVLVLHPIVRRSADVIEPYGLLVKHHQAEPDSSIVTALLLTDPRWRDGVSYLVRRIEDEGVLDTGELDLLARTFLSADKALYWKVPDDWFDSVGVIINVDDEPSMAEQSDEPVGPTVVRRDLPPPLRRWAAARMVRQEPSWQCSLAQFAGAVLQGTHPLVVSVCGVQSAAAEVQYYARLLGRRSAWARAAQVERRHVHSPNLTTWWKASPEETRTPKCSHCDYCRGGRWERGNSVALQIGEGGVEASFADEAGVSALFCNVAVVDDNDAIGAANGRKSVGDDDGRAADHQVFEGLDDEAFGLGVEGAGGFVQDEYGAVPQNCSGYGDALALPARQVRSSLSEHRVKAVR